MTATGTTKPMMSVIYPSLLEHTQVDLPTVESVLHVSCLLRPEGLTEPDCM